MYETKGVEALKRIILQVKRSKVKAENEIGGEEGTGMVLAMMARTMFSDEIRGKGCWYDQRGWHNEG